MKVGIVCPYDLGAAGGVQQLCTELAQRLNAAGDEAIVLGPGEAPGVVTLGSVRAVSANGSRVPLSLSRRISSRLDEAVSDLDLVHVHEPLIPLVGWSAMRTRRPTVLTFHADPPSWVRRMYRTAAPLFARYMQGTVKTAVSDVAASALPGSWGPVTVVPNAIDHASYSVEVTRNPMRVAFLGRDDPRKGLEVVLEAWPGVVAVHPDAELVVMGVARSTGPENVQFVGRVSEPEKRRLLASSAVFVAPNTGGESFGIVLAEAMAAGCAVIASDIPAFRPVAGAAAVYIRPGDTGAWSAAIADLLASPERVGALSRVGIPASMAFDWSNVVRRYRDVYAEALESA